MTPDMDRQSTKTIKEVKTHAPSKCAWCAGSGTLVQSPGAFVSCIVCGGKGHVSIKLPGDKCRACDGSGKRGSVGKCFTCAGSGWEHIVDVKNKGLS